MTLTNVPFTNHGLKDSEINLLRKGNFQTVADLLLTSTQDIAKRCRASPIEIKRIVDMVIAAASPIQLERLDNLSSDGDEKFSTGDDILDKALGGGIRTGMIWEVVGESAAGKTQLALQLSLAVQVPRSLGGLGGGACYLTTSSKLPTERLLQICQADEILSSFSSMEHVHTMPAPTVAFIQNVLTTTLPSFIHHQAEKEDGKPIKLLIVDALGELFHSSTKTTNASLFQRSKDISSISASLHELANTHQMAVVVLNEVIDRFTRFNHNIEDDKDILYENQSRWFSTAEFFGDNKKEASLGLVWANQINTRIMLTRTGRRKYFSDQEFPKRRRMNPPGKDEGSPTQLTELTPNTSEEPQATLIRRLTVIFSNVSSPVALDYVVTEKGIIALPDEILPSSGDDVPITAHSALSGTNGRVEEKLPQPESPAGVPEQDAEEYLWSQADPLSDVDWDAFEQKLSQQVP